MLAAYLFCLLAGGALVGASAIFGGKDVDAGGHLDGDADMSGDAHAHAGDAHGAHATGWLPFFSFQFWTFALAFFGLTGTVLTLLGLASALPTLLASTVLGLGSGTAVSTLIRKLRTQTVSSGVAVGDFVGRSGIVKLPLKAGSAGKIRLTIKEQVIDLLAVTDEKEEIAIGEEILVTEMQDGRAVVVRAVRVEESAHETETASAEANGARRKGQEGS